MTEIRLMSNKKLFEKHIHQGSYWLSEKKTIRRVFKKQWRKNRDPLSLANWALGQADNCLKQIYSMYR